tara:strand:- start:38 stop:493 length:456 start_codon:yes stop_codon:yes gene_type:complete
MGQLCGERTRDYYCNHSCLGSFNRQELGITLLKDLNLMEKNRIKWATGYKAMLKPTPRLALVPDAYECCEYYRLNMSFHKHYALFLSGCLERKTVQELHLLRLKARKYAGELLEYDMVNHSTKGVSEMSNLIKAGLDDETFLINLFERGAD